MMPGTPGMCKENLPQSIPLENPFYYQLSSDHISTSPQGKEKNIRFIAGREMQANFFRKRRSQKQSAEGGIGRKKQS